jgi:hypothetical protein
MGNWHCVPSGCATVAYREYLGGKIRWRYGTEPWQEIIGADNYSINNIVASFSGGQCPKRYNVRVFYDAFSANNKLYQANASVALTLYGPISNVYFAGTTLIINCKNANGSPFVYQTTLAQPIVRAELKSVILAPLVGIDNCGNRLDQYEFKVFKNGVLIRTETRATSPQVEVIPCSLSPETKEIDIKKWAYLDRVEVVNYAYDVQLALLTDIGNYGLLLIKKPIPPECLNVYNNDVTSTIPTNFGQVANTPENGYRLIQQICSAPGCPPPAYDVICDDCCDKCPDYTCPIECGDDVCCYNDYGVAVQTIPKDRYCGGGS